MGAPEAAQLKNWLSRHVKSSENFSMPVSEHGPPNKQPAENKQLKILPSNSAREEILVLEGYLQPTVFSLSGHFVLL